MVDVPGPVRPSLPTVSALRGLTQKELGLVAAGG